MSNVPHLDDIVRRAQQLPRLHSSDDEPPRGSIVMVSSTTGTAAQRFYDDGLWHFTTGEVCDIEQLHLRHDGRQRNVYVVYLAPEEPERVPTE
jgi:hypothetical protein